MKINPHKVKAQERALKLARSNNNLLLKWATGVGKTKATIDIINRFKTKKKVLLVIAEVLHEDNWKEEFKKWKLKSNIKVTITTYASLHKYKGKTFDYLVLDEAHHSGSDLKQHILDNIKAKNVVALSATLPNDILKGLINIFGEFKVFEITLQDAIDTEILPEPKIYLIKKTLDNDKRTQLVEICRGNEKYYKTIITDYPNRWTYLSNKIKYPNLKLKLMCTEREKYFHINDNFEYWKRQYNRFRSIKNKTIFLSRGNLRKRYIGSLKTETAKKVISTLEDKRFICFCTDIKQAEELNSKYAIHSKKKNSDLLVEKFNKGKIDSIFAVGKLQEGQNLNNIEVGIIIQLDGVERGFVQKFGRSLRAEYPEQFIIYIDETKDMDYLENINNLDSKYITTINEEDL